MAMCAFLTGQHPRTCPLKDVPIFTQMKERMLAHCSKLQKVSEDALMPEKKEKRVRLRGKTCKLPMPEVKPTRNHRAPRTSKMLPGCDEIDMSCGIIPWTPIVLLRRGDANVLMEVTAANFQALFKIVQTQIADPDATRDLAAMPKRRPRRPKEHPKAPVDSPRGKKYFIHFKGGWLRCLKSRCLKSDASGSASSARASRRFARVETRSSRAAKCKSSLNKKKRRDPEDVLGKDDDSNSCHSRRVSDSEDR